MSFLDIHDYLLVPFPPLGGAQKNNCSVVHRHGYSTGTAGPTVGSRAATILAALNHNDHTSFRMLQFVRS